jgi:hypothetical protein
MGFVMQMADAKAEDGFRTGRTRAGRQHPGTEAGEAGGAGKKSQRPSGREERDR